MSATSSDGRDTISLTSGGRFGALLELGRNAIERAHDLPDGLGGDSRIERCGVELGMSQQDLDHPDIGVLLQKMRRKAVTKAKASVAIDGSKFKAVNSRDNNFTQGKIQRRQKQIEESVARYMSQLDTADRQTAAGEEPSETVLLTKTRLREKLAKLEEEVKRLAAIEKALLASPDKQISLTDPDCRSMATSGRGSGMV